MTCTGKRSVPTIVISLALISGLAAGAGAATVSVSSSTPYASDAAVPAKVKDECAFETRLPQAIAENGDVALVEGKVSRTKGRSLELAIHGIHAPGGGVFSGPKWATVRGKLRTGGKVIGSFRAKRYSTGGAFGGFTGTCGILNRIANAMGQDIAAFIESPSMGAKLGDAK